MQINQDPIQIKTKKKYIKQIHNQSPMTIKSCQKTRQTKKSPNSACSYRLAQNINYDCNKENRASKNASILGQNITLPRFPSSR